MKKELITVSLLAVFAIITISILATIFEAKDHTLMRASYGFVTKTFEIDDDYSYKVGDTVPVCVVTNVCEDKIAYLGDFDIDATNLKRKVQHHDKHDGLGFEINYNHYAIVDSVYTKRY